MKTVSVITSEKTKRCPLDLAKTLKQIFAWLIVEVKSRRLVVSFYGLYTQ